MKFFQVVVPATVETGEPESPEEREALAEYNALMVEHDALFVEKQRLDARRAALQQPSVNFRGEVVYPPGAVSLQRIEMLGEQIEEVRERAGKALVRRTTAGRRRMLRTRHAEVGEPSPAQGGLRDKVAALLRA